MTRNSRELSQFASFVEVRDANQNIGINTSLVMLGGVGIGSTVGDYLNEVTARGAEDPLINFNKSFLLDDITIEGNIVSTGVAATLPNLNVGGLSTTTDLIVTGITTLSRDSGLGTIYIGQSETTVDRAPAFQAGTGKIKLPSNLVPSLGGISTALVVIDTDNSANSNDVALQVFGRVQFDGVTQPPEPGIDTSFTVNTPALFKEVSFLEPINVIALKGPSRFIASDYHLDLDATGTSLFEPSVFIQGGLDIVGGFTRIGYGLSVGYGLQVGRELGAGGTAHNELAYDTVFYNKVRIESPELIIGFSSESTLKGDTPLNRTEINLADSYFVSNLEPTTLVDPAPGIGSESGRWNTAFLRNLDVGPDDVAIDSQANMVNLNVSLGSTLALVSIAGTGGTDTNEVYLDVGPGKASFANVDSSGFFYHVGVATIEGSFNVISDSYNNAFVATAFQANNVDLYKVDETNTTDPEFFYPAMANSGFAQTDAGGELFVNPGFYLDAFGTSLFVHNNLSVLGTAINASEENVELRFDLLNYGVTELNIASEAQFIDIGQAEQAGSITSIRSQITDVQRLKLSNNDIQASTGSTTIVLDDVDTAFTGYITVGGTSIFAGSNDFYIANDPQRGTLFRQAEDVVIGADDLGIATIRNNVTELTGFLRLGRNVIQSSDEAFAIEVGLGGTFTQFTGDIIVGGNDIQTGFGQTNITMVDTSKTIFAGDIQVNGNDILTSDGNVNITMFDGQELTSFTGAIRVEGNTIQAGTGDTNITLSSNQSTIFAGAIQVNGDTIRASNGQDNILMDSDLLTEFTGDIRVGGAGTIQAGDGTICITLEGGTGNVAIASDVSANSAFFNGLETRLNTQDLNVRDNLVTIGLIEDPTTEGDLIPPNVSVGNSGDVGLVMARYDVGLSTHKYAAIYYDNSEGRVAIRTDVTDAGVGAGRDRYLLSNGLPSELEVKNLYVTNTSSLGIKTIFEANTRDDGETITEVLNVVNVEIDGGVYA